jgi:hypothetical protein
MPNFPSVFFMNGRGFCYRSAIDRYRADLIAAAAGLPPVYPPPPDPDELISLARIAKLFGVTKRTISRWRMRAPEATATAVQAAREPLAAA